MVELLIPSLRQLKRSGARGMTTPNCFCCLARKAYGYTPLLFKYINRTIIRVEWNKCTYERKFYHTTHVPVTTPTNSDS